MRHVTLLAMRMADEERIRVYAESKFDDGNDHNFACGVKFSHGRHIWGGFFGIILPVRILDE